MERLFTRDQLARFGLFLLGDERRETYAKTNGDGSPLEDRLRIVNHQDVTNFLEGEKDNDFLSSLMEDIKSLNHYAWDETGMIENKEGVPIEDVFILRQDLIELIIYK